MDLRGQIINILADANRAGTDDVRLAYLHGHRDARHAAAELASEHDALTECRTAAELDRLRAALAKANEQAEHFERLWYLRGDLLEEVRGCFTRDDELPDGLLLRIDAALTPNTELFGGKWRWK